MAVRDLDHGFSWYGILRLFLLELLLCGVSTISFLFYFNRLFATLVFYGVRAYCWHKYRVHIEIQALQFSLLAGRVFFKGLRYHGHNETVLVNDGYITWRYWLRRVREANWNGSGRTEKGRHGEENRTGHNPSDDEDAGTKVLSTLPCRIVVKGRGLEWFIYNRSAAYDTILKNVSSDDVLKGAAEDVYSKEKTRLNKANSAPAGSGQYETSRTYRLPQAFNSKHGLSENFEDGVNIEDKSSTNTEASSDIATQQTGEGMIKLPTILKILPVRLECNKGAIVMGNRNTRSILVARFDVANGQIDACSSCSMDQYKQSIDLNFIHPVIQLKFNREFKEAQLDNGARAKPDDVQDSALEAPSHMLVALRQWLSRIWRSVYKLTSHGMKSSDSIAHEFSRGGPGTSPSNAGVPGQNRWLGLTRYLDDGDDAVEQERWKAIEYGQVSTVIDSPSIAMSFYWDVPGSVKNVIEDHRFTSSTSREAERDINGDSPPDWGVHLRVGGGTISYGPWADRQRVDLQTVFFPSLYKDAVPATKLFPGQPRVSTVFKLVLEIEEQTSLLIPTREESKDWKWKERRTGIGEIGDRKKGRKGHVRKKKGEKAAPSPDVRPFGWLEVKVLPNSTISFTMDLFANTNGFKNRVDLDLRGPEMSSSVNHGLLWQSKSQVISCNLFYPLGWNALRQWQVDIQGDDLELFILRDHVFLLTDLISDWASGPPGDFHIFVPFNYAITFRFSNFKLYINVNDSNIIDNPSDVDDNTFVVVWGEEMTAGLDIPLKTFRPIQNQIPFNITARNGGFKIRTPSWNTQHTFLDDADVAALQRLKIDGSYNYFASTSPALTDTLHLEVHGVTLRVLLHGFLVRYLMKIKDNYFGEDLHFRTLEEYQFQVTQRDVDPKATTNNQQNKLTNDLDVILSVTAEESEIFVPIHLYSAVESIKLDISSITGDVRFTNYYMDLAVSFSPAAISSAASVKHPSSATDQESSTQLFVDGLDILGHRLFGLPPTEPTYVCNWDFTVGIVTGECSVLFLHSLLLASRSFKLSFGDAENALPSLHPLVLHDVTFFRARVSSVTVWLHVEKAAFLFSTEEIRVNYNDWAGPLFSERLYVLIPGLIFAIVDASVALADRSRAQSPAITYAYIETTVELRMALRNLESNKDRLLQQHQVCVHDARTRRTTWLAQDTGQANISGIINHRTKIRPPAMPLPPMPEPVFHSHDAMIDDSSLSSRSIRTKSSQESSFLATTSPWQTKVRSGTSKEANRYSTEPKFSASRLQTDMGHSWASSTSQPKPSYPTQTTQKASHLCYPADSIRSPYGSATMGFAFSSPYKRPRFPLHGMEPDASDAPILPQNIPSDHLLNDPIASDRTEPQTSGQDVEQSSYMIQLNKGLRAFCTPKALHVVADLLEQFQTRDTVALLDTLQIDTMAYVLKSFANHKSKRNLIQVRLYVSCLQARFLDSTAHDSATSVKRASYELGLANLTATTRSSTDAANDKGNPAGHLSIHVVLAQIDCSAKENFGESPEDQATVHFVVKEPLLWLVSGARSSADVKFGNLDIISSGHKVGLVFSLIQQTVSTLEGFVGKLSKITEKQAARVRMLVLSLTTDWDSVPDPPFLTRASYVLRSAASHMRTSDSWKIISRLRYVHHSLPVGSQKRIFEEYRQTESFSRLEACSHVISNLDNWRTWDVAHVRESLLIQNVFGISANTIPEQVKTPQPFEISMRAGEIQVLIEPGPKQNRLAMNKMILIIALYHPARAIDGLAEHDVIGALNSTIQLYCGQSTMYLSWELCSLLDEALRFLTTKSKVKPASNDEIPTVNPSVQAHRFHIAVFSEVSTLSFDAINIKGASMCEGLNTSLIIAKDHKGSRGFAVNLLTSASTVTSEIQSHSRVLTQSKLRRPSIFIFVSDHTINTNRTWRFGFSSTEISFEVVEHPLGMLEIADLLLKDELTYIKRLSQSSQPTSGRGPPSKAWHKIFGEVRVALLIDEYLISFAILPSLTYRLAGQGAQGSLKPGKLETSELVVDFGLRDHTHMFVSHTDNASDEFSTLRIPPINGRLTLNLKPEQTVVSFHCMIESIILNASAVHTLVAITIRPEVISVGMNMNRYFCSVRDNYQELFQSERQIQPNHQERILYVAYVTLAGLSVNACTPTSTSGSWSAQLLFALGCVQLKATNRDKDRESTAVQFPELQLNLVEMKVNLTQRNISDIRLCGDLAVDALFKSTSKVDDGGDLVRAYLIHSRGLEVNLHAQTASVVAEILGHLQKSLKTIDLSNEAKRLRRFRRPKSRTDVTVFEPVTDNDDAVSTLLSTAMYSIEMSMVRISWNIGSTLLMSPGREAEDLILSFARVDVATKKNNAARLLVQETLLQMVPASRTTTGRSLNSALLPEVVFNVAYLSTSKDRRLAFQAVGKSLDIRLTPQFILPATDLRRSIALAFTELRAATAAWNTPVGQTDDQSHYFLSHKKLASLLVDADFAGAVVYIQGRNFLDQDPPAVNSLRSGRLPQHGRYGQFSHEDSSSSTTLRAPGIALKIEYKDAGVDKQSLNAEFKVDASLNVLYPTVVPLLMEILSSVKEVVEESDNQEQNVYQEPKLSPPKFLNDGKLRTADPSAILSNCRLNLGLRICRQEFSLSCQPIARVAATARFDDIYVTINTVQSADFGQFFTLSAAFSRFQASVQHVYSRESTASFDVDSIVLSLMNSKHVSAANGLSAILKISPMKAQINAKQMQDFLLFREIWIPPEVRHPSSAAPVRTPFSEPQAFGVQRYQQVTAAGTFPWNATVSIAELDVQLDLGQSLGKSALIVSNFWISSKKSSDWEQNLCIGFEKVGVDCTGRMSGFISLQDFIIRTSIQWPAEQELRNQTPLIQASLSLDHLRVKAAFDYQAFLIVDTTVLSFLMYNVRDSQQIGGDRLVGVVDGEKVQAFCTTTSASQGLALYQAIERLIQEKQAAYEVSLKDIEKYLRRKSTVGPSALRAASRQEVSVGPRTSKTPLQLQTNVVVTLKAVNIGAFPSTFLDNQIFKLEALDVSARFAVVLNHERLHSRLGMTLGQIRIALSSVTKSNSPKTLGEVSVEEVIACAIGSRGGTILKVPRLVATMQTWQTPESSHIDYIFKSSFQGKVDVGWNYSRISFLRGMWTSHTRALAQRLGKPLPQSALHITDPTQREGEDGGENFGEGGPKKITAVVNVPQSKYQYVALQPPIIETPQLRDMGEATPPLEWIGLHRERLPNLTHQIVIVTLLEVAKEVEDAYARILGSS